MIVSSPEFSKTKLAYIAWNYRLLVMLTLALPLLMATFIALMVLLPVEWKGLKFLLGLPILFMIFIGFFMRWIVTSSIQDQVKSFALFGSTLYPPAGSFAMRKAKEVLRKNGYRWTFLWPLPSK